jgi:hypothetical protein
MDTTIVFNVEPEDRSVGIFGEGFSAWTLNGAEWCDLADYQVSFEKCKFVWYDNETGNVCARPLYASVVEHALHGYANGVYAEDEECYERMEASAAECGSNPDLISEDRPLPDE